MVHRTVLGSMERFVGTLIEHYAGAFPLWLAPVQLKVLPVNSEFHMEYASKIFELLKDNGFRVEIDDRNEKLGYKMREAQTMKIPYSVIIGEKERDNNTISYREYGKEDTTTVSVDEFILMLNKKISDKK
jgi:threonyl-tRNA synthetase